MSLEQTACEGNLTEVIYSYVMSTNFFKTIIQQLCFNTIPDLKAFERRLTEVIGCLQPSTLRWRIILIVVSICTAVGAWYWLTDPALSTISFSQSLWSHLFFTISSSTLVILFLFGIHKRVMAPSIIASRTRVVLSDFNMSCDETGKLILKPRPTVT